MKPIKGAAGPSTPPTIGALHQVPPSPRSQKLTPDHHHHHHQHSVKGKSSPIFPLKSKSGKRSHHLPPTVEAQPVPQPILRQPTSEFKHGALSYRRYDSMPNIAHAPTLQQALREEPLTTKGLVRHHRSDPERPVLPLVPATPFTNSSPRLYPSTPPVANTVRFEDPFRRGMEPRRPVGGVGGGGRLGPNGARNPEMEGRRIVSGPAPTSALKMKDRYPAIPQPYPQPQAGGGGVGAAHGYGHGDGYDDPRHPNPNRPRTVSTPAPRAPLPASPYAAPMTARSRKPDPRRVLTALELIRGEEFNVKEYLSTFELMRDHQLDQVDDEQRERERERVRVRARTVGDARRPEIRKAEENQRDKPALPSVLSAPLRKTSIYASTPVVVDGHEHDVPIIVVHTVEELRRTALHDHDFLRGNPNSDRVAELMHVYDAEQSPDHIAIPPRPPTRPGGSGRPVAGMGGRIHGQEHGLGAGVGLGFGMSASLHEEASADLGALLSTYISSLPEPVLRAFLFDAIWDMCGVDDEYDDARDDDYADSPAGWTASTLARNTNTNTNANRRDSKRDAVAWSNTDLNDMDMWPPTPRMERTYTSPEDATKIATAQLLLHLLPSPHFSLLVYLMYFFSDVAEREESNGLGVKELARVFGASIFGRRDSPPPVSPVVRPGAMPRTRKRSDATAGWQTHELKGILRNTRRRDGETMMRWFLRRWGPISDGLFDVLKDVEMGLFRRTNMRKDSFGKDILASAGAGAGLGVGGGGGFTQGSLVPPGILDDEDEDASVLGSMTTVHDRMLEDDSASDIYVEHEDEPVVERKEGRDTPHPVKGDRLERAGEYFAGGFSFAPNDVLGTQDQTRSRRDSTADTSMLRQKETVMGVDVESLEQNAIGDEDAVVVAPFNDEGDPVASDGTQEVRRDSSSIIEGLDERLGDLDSNISNLMHEYIQPVSNRRPPNPPGLGGQAASIPEIVVENATPPNSTPPLPSTQTSVAEVTGDVVAALKEQNIALQNTVSRLEAELAKAKRDICATSEAGTVAPSVMAGDSNGLDKGAAQAVEIVAEIRKLMMAKD